MSIISPLNNCNSHILGAHFTYVFSATQILQRLIPCAVDDTFQDVQEKFTMKESFHIQQMNSSLAAGLSLTLYPALTLDSIHNLFLLPSAFSAS
jgi:hypothetical protein